MSRTNLDQTPNTLDIGFENFLSTDNELDLDNSESDGGGGDGDISNTGKIQKYPPLRFVN